MPRAIGLVGILGVLLVLAGIVVIGYVDPVLAAGVTAMLIGIVLVVRDLVSNVLASFGFQGAF